VKPENHSNASLATRSIEDQLQRILASKAFTPSARMSRFLRFAVELTLRGEAEQLKEYVLGVEVFDRSPSYDPRVDPIVRVEARRLRSKLTSYYDGEGRGDELIIDFPKGTYAPVFRQRSATHAAAPVQPPRTDAIAVLPFSNLSAEPDTEYFSDGLTEELIHGLTKLDGLMVVAWSSAARLKGQPYDIREIGRQLNVCCVLVGSVRSSGERLRVMVQLVDTSSGRYLWTETYDRKIEDLFAIQEEISRAIVQTLQPRLVTPAIRHGEHSPECLEAYNLYLKGRFQWNKRTAEGLKRSVQHFEQAIGLDPGFALGYAGLADAYTLLADYGLVNSGDIMPAAKSAARKALEIDPTLAEAHTSLGLIRSIYDWEWAEAETHYRRAMELNPGYATTHYWFAVDYLGTMGRTDEAFAEIELAQQLDPLSPIIREGKGYLLMLSRRYDEAIEEYRQLLDLDCFFYKGFTSMGRAYAQKGMYEEAITMLQKGRSLAGEIPSILGALGQTYALLRRPDDARRLLDELAELAKRRHVSSTCFALIHLGLGEKERALEWLETGLRGRETALSALKAHPAYDGLRGEPRFHALLQKLGLASTAVSEAC